MSHRLNVLIPEEMEARLDEAAKRARVSRSELVRRAIEALVGDRSGLDALVELSRLEAPTCDIDQMLDEIGPTGREGVA